jgi:hypothetical protein
MKWHKKCFQMGVGQRRVVFVFIYSHGGEFLKINILSNYRVFEWPGIAQSI